MLRLNHKVTLKTNICFIYNMTHVLFSWFKTHSCPHPKQEEQHVMEACIPFLSTYLPTEPKQCALPGWKGRSTPWSPLQTDRVQESKLHFLLLYPVGLCRRLAPLWAAPGAPSISIPTQWFGLSLLDVDKERQKVANSPSLGWLPISFGPQKCPGVMGLI